MPLKITHSLLSSWLYATGENATDSSMGAFLNTLGRAPCKDTGAIIEGRQFESLVNAYIKLPHDKIECDNEKWEAAAKSFGKMCAGGTLQVYLQKPATIGGVDYKMVGVADVVRAGRIFDIKKVQRYEYGKYFESTQHPMYFELIPRATRFDYLIFDGNACYTETYRHGDFTPIEVTISRFSDFLRGQGLWKLYEQKWRVE